MATPPSVDSEATALLVARELGALGVRVTRIASGVPHGGDLECADQVTLGRRSWGASPSVRPTRVTMFHCNLEHTGVCPAGELAKEPKVVWTTVTGGSVVRRQRRRYDVRPRRSDRRGALEVPRRGGDLVVVRDSARHGLLQRGQGRALRARRTDGRQALVVQDGQGGAVLLPVPTGTSTSRRPRSPATASTSAATMDGHLYALDAATGSRGGRSRPSAARTRSARCRRCRRSRGAWCTSGAGTRPSTRSTRRPARRGGRPRSRRARGSSRAPRSSGAGSSTGRATTTPCARRTPTRARSSARTTRSGACSRRRSSWATASSSGSPTRGRCGSTS